MFVKLWVKQLLVLGLSLAVFTVGVVRFPLRISGVISTLIAVGMTVTGFVGCLVAFRPYKYAVLTVAVGGAALLVLDTINMTLILFAKAWKFEESGYWLIPEIILLFSFALMMYLFYSGKRWIKVRRKDAILPTEHTKLVLDDKRNVALITEDSL